jgi:hypothetical protein
VSQLDDILARSRSPGAFVERSRFTLARDKAVEKLRQYALRDPRRYILELVSSGVFAGARFMAVDVNKDEVVVAWVGGRPFQAVDLEHLFDYLLSRRHGSDNQHLIQLAVGVNALLQRSPEMLSIESGDGTPAGTVRMDIDTNGQAVQGNPETGLMGTYVTAHFGTDWFARFMNTQHNTPEASLIESHCQYCTVPILLNGRAPFGWRGGRPRLTGAVFDDGHRWGTVYRATDRDNRFRIVLGGVVVTEMVLPDLGRAPHPQHGGIQPAVRGVICDDNLRLTADHSDIVQDRAFHQMLHAVQPHCTELIEVRERDYTPPPLEPIPDLQVPKTEAAPRVAAEPLPDLIVQLGHRSKVPVAAIGVNASNAPAFWVRPGDAARLEMAASVLRLPYPVYILTPGQVRTLEERFPDAGVLPLGRPADVDFVVRAIERAAFRPTVEARFDHLGVSGRLRIRATLRGPGIRWEVDAAADGVPTVIAVGDKVVAATNLTGLGIPGIDVTLVLDPDEAAPEHTAPLFLQVREALVTEVWRLFDHLVTPFDDPEAENARQDIVAGALASVAQPHFVRGAEHTELVAHFPRETAAIEAALRTTPLLRCTTGPLSFDDFIALQGTLNTVVIAPHENGDRMDPLEQRFGHGNVRRDAQEAFILLVLAVPSRARPGTYRWVTTVADPAETEFAVAIWIGADIGTQMDPELAAPIELGLAGLGAARAHASDAEIDLREGLDLLFETAAALQRGEAVAGLGEVMRDERSRAMVRLAIASLVDSDSEWRNIPLFSVGDEYWSLGRIRDRRDFGVVPAGGVAAASPHVVALTLDEVRAIERVGDESVPLRFDDNPGLWMDAEAEDWLVRIPLQYDEMRGWVGLRHPFDPTGGILFRGRSGLTSTASPRRDAPCHGMVWSRDRTETGANVPVHLLDLALHKLYLALAERLEAHRWSDERARTAESYGAAWTLDDLRTAGDVSSDLSRRFAQSVTIWTEPGDPWGSLADWINSPATARPDIAADRETATGIIPSLATPPMPSMDLDLAPWLTGVVRRVTSVDNLTVTLERVLMSDISTFRINPRLTVVRRPNGIWRRLHLRIRGDILDAATDPRVGLEMRWMIALIVIRHWVPTLQWADRELDFWTIQQEMLSRLMAATD